MRKKKSGRSKWPPGFGKIQKILRRQQGTDSEDPADSAAAVISHTAAAAGHNSEKLNLLKSDKSENISSGSKV